MFQWLKKRFMSQCEERRPDVTAKLLPVCLAVWVAVRATRRRQSNLSRGEVCLLRALSSRLARDKLMLQRHDKTEEEEEVRRRSSVLVLDTLDVNKLFNWF